MISEVRLKLLFCLSWLWIQLPSDFNYSVSVFVPMGSLPWVLPSLFAAMHDRLTALVFASNQQSLPCLLWLPLLWLLLR